jgi:two-component system cell cycle response regulator CtrA
MPSVQPSYVEVLEADNDALRARVAALEAEVAKLSASAEVVVMTPIKAFGLTPTEGKVFARIAATGFATKQDIYATICAGQKTHPEPKVVDVYVHKVRAKVERFDIVIETAHGRGYSIGPDSRAKIAAMQAGTDVAVPG